VYAKGAFRNINPFAQDLLRIEYDADGKHVVTGFLVRRAMNGVRNSPNERGIVRCAGRA